MNIQFSDLIKNSPNAPGIYKMFDYDNNLLYVGKAKNINKRLKQYCDISKLEPHKQIMRTFVKRIEWEITPTEADALILEQKLIKTQKPKYNIMLTDDKMYPMLSLTKHQFPRLLKFRGKISQKNDIFGPYPSVYALNETIKTIQKVCKLRTCSDNFMKNRIRPCLLHQIGHCSAPCTIQQNNYSENVKLARKILTGDSEPIIKEFTLKMQSASTNLDFETAASLRDKIIALTYTANRGNASKNSSFQNNTSLNWTNTFQELCEWLGLKIKHCGVFDNSHLFGTFAVGAIITFNEQGFIKSGYKHFLLQNKTYAGNDIAMMEEFIKRAINNDPYLDLIIVDGGISQWNIAKKITTNIPILGITKGKVRNGDEHFIMPNGKICKSLKKDSNLFLLLRAVRDEAHRFVITYHRTVRSKKMTASILDNIEGIGSKRKKTLLNHFGSVQEIINASQYDLEKVPGLGSDIAKKIYAYFHSFLL